MIKVMFRQMKDGGGPGKFMHRLANYMQNHEMVRLVDHRPDIYLSTVWRGSPPARCKVIYRAASVYYNRHDKKRAGQNKKLASAIVLADHVIYQSNFAQKLCEKVLSRELKRRIRAKRRSVITNGFDKHDYEHVPAASNSHEHTFVACADWSSAAKRGVYIIKCFNRAEIQDSQLIMVGKTNKRIEGRGSDNVKLLGRQPFENVVTLLKSKVIFVHLSYVESCPNAVIEALSFGCPVVCNNIGATPEIVKDSGLIANCDKRFKFRRRDVDLAIKDPGEVIKALHGSTQRNWNINRAELSMDHCANEYRKAFEKVLG